MVDGHVALLSLVASPAHLARTPTVTTGGSFGASPLRQEIGLGQAQSIDAVEIFWPTTGQTQMLKDLSMDRFYKVREGDTAAVAWNVRSFKLRPPDEKLCAPPGTILPARSTSLQKHASDSGAY